MLKTLVNGVINYNLFLAFRPSIRLSHIASSEILVNSIGNVLHSDVGEKGMLNETIAFATIIINCLEKLVSYRLQADKPYLIQESNPLARIVISRCGLLSTHLAFSFLSVAIVCLTYVLSWTSSIASVCLWLELSCSAIVFSNNLRLNRHS